MIIHEAEDCNGEITLRVVGGLSGGNVSGGEKRIYFVYTRASCRSHIHSRPQPLVAKMTSDASEIGVRDLS